MIGSRIYNVFFNYTVWLPDIISFYVIVLIFNIIFVTA